MFTKVIATILQAVAHGACGYLLQKNPLFVQTLASKDNL